MTEERLEQIERLHQRRIKGITHTVVDMAMGELLAEVRRLQEAGVVLTQHVAGCAAEGCSCRKNWAIAQFRKDAR